MGGHRWWTLLGGAAAAGMMAAGVVAAADAGLAVELNRLEDRDGTCRVHVVFSNRTPSMFEAFRLDLVFFGRDGVIARRLAVDAAPLRAEKTTVKLFDIANLACKEIGQVLVNDVVSCRDATGERTDCVELLSVSSRADAPLVK